MLVIGGKKIITGGDLWLEILVIYKLYGIPKYLARLNELIKTNETTKQSLIIEYEDVSSPKEPRRKKFFK